MYDALDLYQHSIPPRSILYQLPPMGIGTPIVESLTSYLTRLAVSHTVTVGTLLERQVAPLIDKKYGVANLHGISRVTGALNGIGSMSRDLVHALAHLTMRQDLQLLTMVSFSAVIPSRNLIRDVRSWCPHCYQAWFDNGDSLYEPLLWSLKLVRYCPVHQSPLVDKCPDCQQHNPPFGRKFQLGYCSLCYSWLGNDSIKRNNQISIVDLELWRSKSLGDLLTMTFSSRGKLSIDNIPRQLSNITNEATAGNIAALSRQLRIPKNTLWLWYHGKTLPSLESSLNICRHFDISLVDFFSGENQDRPKLDNYHKPTSRAKTSTSNRAFKPEVVCLFLEQVLSQEILPPLSVTEIARRLGCNRRMLYKHFPDLCSVISNIYKNYLKQTHEENLAWYCQQVRQIVVDLYQEGEYPSESRVAAQMTKPGFLRYKEVRSALKSAKTTCELTTMPDKKMEACYLANDR
jgi:transcriptional regulator with XRE-family HTH domain